MAKFRSGSEKTTADFLKARKINYKYEPDYIKYEWREERKYLPDFILSNGIIIEVKGRFTLQDRKKHLFVRKEHPDLDIRFVFDNYKKKLYKGSKTTYADWCLKNGFKFTSLAEIALLKEWNEEPPWK